MISEKHHISLSWSLYLTVMLIPLFFAVWNIVSGNTPFWYDNARDLLSGWDNLQKPTLIGPTSGIPGIFYGPYWTWLLSLGVAISKDPRASGVLVGVIPYFLIFPLTLLWIFNVYTRSTVFVVWLLFIFGIGFSYATNMWNPHIAPVLFLMFLTCFVKMGKTTDKQQIFFTISSGWTLGVLLNFHISFGIGVFSGVIFYGMFVVLQNLKRRTLGEEIYKYLPKIFYFFCGTFFAGAPFLLFEIKHGFYQTKTALETLFSYGSTIPLNGLSDSQILVHFFGRFGQLLHLPLALAIPLELVLGAYITKRIIKNTSYFTEWEKRLVYLLISITAGILFIYLSARNPVWEYHFIGVEIIFFILFVIVLNKHRVLMQLTTGWIVIIGGLFLYQHSQSLLSNPLFSPSLVTKEYIVDAIADDAKGSAYVVYAYSPSIYTYEYTYLFRWRYGKNIPFDPNAIPAGSERVYLILPKATDPVLQDFIQYRTPPEEYSTTASWKIPDGTEILKREKNL